MFPAKAQFVAEHNLSLRTTVTRVVFALCVAAWLASTAGEKCALAVEPQWQRLYDEWQPISHIVISTSPGENDYAPNRLAVFAAAMASRQGIRVVVATDSGPDSQQLLLKHFQESRFPRDGHPLIERSSDVVFIPTRMPGGWARDFAPIVVHPKPDGVILCGFNVLESFFESKSNAAAFARVLGTPSSMAMASIGGDRFIPLRFQGGDWMTSDYGQDLITTTSAINSHQPSSSNSGYAGVPTAITNTLQKSFGIRRVLALSPIHTHKGSYRLNNTHVDLQVRTLPDNKVIVAQVAEDDVQYDILDQNARALEDAGYQVIRIDNATQVLPRETETGSRFFKSYTNALFLNRVVLIPAYGDAVHDRQAKLFYENSLNEGLAPQHEPYTVVSIPAGDGAAAAEFSASIRCAARELHPLQPAATQ